MQFECRGDLFGQVALRWGLCRLFQHGDFFTFLRTLFTCPHAVPIIGMGIMFCALLSALLAGFNAHFA